MRNPLLSPLLLLFIAAALYLLPDGAFYSWRLWLRGVFIRLERPSDPREDVSEAASFLPRDLLDILAQRDVEIAELNRRLRELGVTREKAVNALVIPARVVRLGPNNNLDTFTIDAGSLAGVEVGQAVAVGQSIVGVIVRSEAEASMVLSLSSPGCYISARLGDPEISQDRPRILAAIQGVGGGRIKAIVFSSEEVAKDGWVAMTSGLEKDIPEGLLIGTLVERFAEGVESGTREAYLQPGTDLSSLDYVAVVAEKRTELKIADGK